jgi:hypothetical protein
MTKTGSELPGLFFKISFFRFFQKGTLQAAEICYNNIAVWARSSVGRRSGSVITPLFR